MGKYDVDVAGSAKVGAIGDYATVFQIFLSPRDDLKAYVRARDFMATIEERTKAFVGRDFVFDAIDDLIGSDDFPSGYVVIQGEPGIGKTSVLGQFVKRTGSVHHLHSVQGVRSVEAFLENVCAQLMIRYGIEEAFPARATADSGYLSALLSDVAANKDNRPVIVAVDALDEAEHAHGLGLPTSLPEGAYFVVTMREGSDINLSVDNPRPIYIREDDPQNREDVRRYVEQYIRSRPRTMPGRIADWHVTEADFASVLVEKSEGNFMYLVQVLRDINSGLLSAATLDDVDQLPSGLRDYYRRHWEAMQSRDADLFTRYEQPVICLLATARESVSQPQLAEWTKSLWAGLEDVDRFDPVSVTGVIKRWREYLNARRLPDGAWGYRIYHASLGDYIREEIGITRYHAAIARMAMARIDGFSGL